MTARALEDAETDTGASPGITMTEFVVDAGVAIKWHVPEVHEIEAKRFLHPDYALHVPDLLFPEFGNIVWKKAQLLKVPELTQTEGRAIIDLLLKVSLLVHPMAPLIKSGNELALGPKRTTFFYDCCYLALAIALECRLVTADRMFYDACIAGPHRAHLLWFADPI